MKPRYVHISRKKFNELKKISDQANHLKKENLEYHQRMLQAEHQVQVLKQEILDLEEIE